MPATALTSPETAPLRAPTRTQEGAGASRRGPSSGSTLDLDEFAAAWETRSARAERGRLSGSPEVEKQDAHEPSIETGPATSGTEPAAEPLSEETLRSWTLREFGRSGLAVKVESSLLHDTIWLLAEDEEAEDEHFGAPSNATIASLEKSLEREGPVYRASELEGLLGLDEKPLEDLHRLKRAFGVRFETTDRPADQSPLARVREEIPLEWLESEETAVAPSPAPSQEASPDDAPPSADERLGA